MSARHQLKCICESTKQTDCNYYITMHDINRIQQIAEDEKVWLDENDAICKGVHSLMPDLGCF